MLLDLRFCQSEEFVKSVKNVQKTQKSIHETVEEFISVKTAQKVRERTIREYRVYLDDFVYATSDSLEVDATSELYAFKREILENFGEIPMTSLVHFNDP